MGSLMIICEGGVGVALIMGRGVIIIDGIGACVGTTIVGVGV